MLGQILPFVAIFGNFDSLTQASKVEMSRKFHKPGNILGGIHDISNNEVDC